MAIQHLDIDLVLSKEAKNLILDRMSKCGLESPVAGLIWGKWEHEEDQHWSIGFYEKAKVIDGWIFEASGVPFYTYQDFMFGELDKKLLDIVEGVIVLKERAASD
ncbi:MAG TPA: hypothetical protein VF268_16260 [Gammaproteobacteria bacterium]